MDKVCLVDRLICFTIVLASICLGDWNPNLLNDNIHQAFYLFIYVMLCYQRCFLFHFLLLVPHPSPLPPAYFVFHN